MASRLLFLSHVHEEKDLALLLKEALEAEFSGFVDVFVSSDGVCIPPGSNFLRKIEDGLVCCVGAMYLISPLSTRRHWVSFELGAVWIRNALNAANGGPQIPALPICHSGMSPGEMPAPLNHLNGIVASDPISLEAAFKSLQSAVGGRGALRTDFATLALDISETEKRYATEFAILAAAHQPPRAPPIRPALEAIRVAIVDDHQIVRSGMTQYLSESSDIEVVGTAANGAEAIELVKRRKIDVLTLDLSMPATSPRFQ